MFFLGSRTVIVEVAIVVIVLYSKYYIYIYYINKKVKMFFSKDPIQRFTNQTIEKPGKTSKSIN